MSSPVRTLWITILAVALLARLTFVAVVPPVIQWSDGEQFNAVALDLVDHRTYGMQTLRPPGYPTFMAGVYALFGKSLVPRRAVEAALGTISVALIGLIGVRLFGPMPGLISAALAALHPVLAFLPSTEYSENLAVLLVVVALAALFAAWRSGRWWQWALGGFTFGLAVQVRPNLLVLFGGFALGLAWALRRQRRPWLLPLAVCSAALVLAVVPWTVRNHRVHDRWFFVSTGGGRQFWFGNNEQTSGSTRVHPEPDAEMWADLERLPNDFEKEAYFYRKGAEFVRAHPARAAWLYLVKLGNLYALYPDTKSRTYINLWSEWAQSLASVVIYIGALLGLRRWRSEPPLWPMVAGIVTFTAVNALYFSCMRYRMAFEPMLMLMAGLGWAGAVAGRRAAAIATPGRA